MPANQPANQEVDEEVADDEDPREVAAAAATAAVNEVVADEEACSLATTRDAVSAELNGSSALSVAVLPPPPPPPRQLLRDTHPVASSGDTHPVAKPLPRISTAPWTYAENLAAQVLLQDSTTALQCASTAESIYAIFNRVHLCFEDWDVAELQAKVRVLQLVEHAMTDDRCLSSHAMTELKRSCGAHGKHSMEALVKTYDWTNLEEDRKVEEYFVKTARDMLQQYWIHSLLLDHRYYFGYNVCQAAFTKWSGIGHRILGEGWQWSTHGLADLCETLTIYFPAKVCHHYLLCAANFHKLFYSHMHVARCQRVGRIPCYKQVVGGTCFCINHQADIDKESSGDTHPVAKPPPPSRAKRPPPSQPPAT